MVLAKKLMQIGPDKAGNDTGGVLFILLKAGGKCIAKMWKNSGIPDTIANLAQHNILSNAFGRRPVVTARNNATAKVDQSELKPIELSEKQKTNIIDFVINQQKPSTWKEERLEQLTIVNASAYLTTDEIKNKALSIKTKVANNEAQILTMLGQDPVKGKVLGSLTKPYLKNPEIPDENKSKMKALIAENKELDASYAKLKQLDVSSESVFEDFCTAIISQFTNAEINPAKNSENSPQFHDLNNNGLKIDRENCTFTGEKKSIQVNDAFVEVELVSDFRIDGKEYSVSTVEDKMEGHAVDFSKAYFYEGRLYSGIEDVRYHDKAAVSGGSGEPAVMTATDGSGHSNGAKQAAEKGNKAAHDHINDNIKNCTTLHEVLHLQMQAVKLAANAVEELAKVEPKPPKTTYIQTIQVGDILTGAAIGDSKAYIFRKDENEKWTALDPMGNIKNTLDVSKAGSQLGEVGSGTAGLAGVHLFACKLQPGDIVYVCSDGISDNIEPGLNGVNPKEAANKFEDEYADIGDEQWQNITPKHIELATKYAANKLTEIIQNGNGNNGADHLRAINNFLEANTEEKKLKLLTAREEAIEHGIEKRYHGKLDDGVSAFMEYNPKR
ncbi:MAG: protein phosphatase 2C domain-containing protein [Candidatus Protochlamydia sp.]|nr:protein phosphatase 2C domain-containing protein [Candidatus Protochlamydia sp.]